MTEQAKSEDRSEMSEDESPEGFQGDEQAGAASEEPQNRRARRAAASQARKQRLRERREAEAVGLDAQEIIDDALVRGTDTAAKWFRRNSTTLQWIVVVGVAAWAGWGVFKWQTASSKAKASDALAAAVAAERGTIGDPSEQGKLNDQKVIDPTPIFENAEQRLNEAASLFEQAGQLRENSGTAAWAQLSRAGVLLDKGDFDGAAALYEQAKQSPQAAGDPELRGRAIEGLALVAAAKGDKEAAIKRYRELENAEIDGFTTLALYQQARLALELGKRDEARPIAEKLNEKLGPSDLGPKLGYVERGAQLLNDELGIQAPTAAPSEPGSITPEQLEALQKQVQQQINNAAQQKKDAPAAPAGSAPDAPARAPEQAPKQ